MKAVKRAVVEYHKLIFGSAGHRFMASNPEKMMRHCKTAQHSYKNQP